MLNRRWCLRLAVLAAWCAVSPAALPGTVGAAPLPGTAGAAVPHADARFSGSAAADGIRDNEQWVLNLLDVPAACSLSQGAGGTVAGLDSGVDPNVSDLTGSAVTGPHNTTITTSPSHPTRPAPPPS